MGISTRKLLESICRSISIVNGILIHHLDELVDIVLAKQTNKQFVIPIDFQSTTALP